MDISALVEKLWTIREQLREIARQEKDLRDAYNETSAALITQLDTMGVSSLKTPVARISITESQVAKLADWDAFTQYVKENDAFYLLQKRPAANAIKELNNITGSTPPGIELLTLRDISMRVT